MVITIRTKGSVVCVRSVSSCEGVGFEFSCSIFVCPICSRKVGGVCFHERTGFNMHSGHCNPLHLPEDEQVDRLSNQLITGKLIQIDQNKLLFPALISTNICANDNLTIDFEAHISTKVDYSFNDVSKQ